MGKLNIALILLALSTQVGANQSEAEDLTDLSIEQLLEVEVISASRLGQKTSQAPSAVSVVKASEIRTFGWRTLADALNGMRGLFTTNDRNYTSLGVRGFMMPGDFNSRVLIMVDGMRMNDNIYDASFTAQEFMLDLDLVERIEFIPGSGSTIYGANAFLGLINVITKQGKAINGVQLAGEIGTFNTYKTRLSYGKQFANGADVLFSASHYDSGGVKNLYVPAYDSPDTNNGTAHDVDAERADRLFGRIQMGEFTLSGGYVDRFKRIPTAPYGSVFNDPTSHSNDRQFFGNLKYETHLDDKTTLLVKGFYQHNDYHAHDIYDPETRTVFRDETSGNWFGGDLQLTTTLFERHRLIAGLEYQYDQRQLQKTFDLDPYYEYSKTNNHGHRLELFVQDDIQLMDSLIFSAGLRFDYHHMVKGFQLNPRLGLIWNPLTNTTFKLLYSSTFRAPNAAEADYNPYYFGVNTRLSVERIKSYEGIVEWHSTDGIKLFGSLFYNDISKLLQASFLSDELLANSGRYELYGAEMEAEKRWENGRLLKASYTHTLMKNETNHGSRAVGSPQNIFKIHYAEPLFDNFATLGLEHIYIGNRKTGNGNMADAYNLLNLNLTSNKIINGLDVSFAVYNLFDTRPQMLGSGVNDILQMNGREFRLKLQLTY